MTPAVDDAVRELLRRIEALQATYADDGFVVPFERCRARRKVFAQAALVREKIAAPLKITPWSPWNQGAAE